MISDLLACGLELFGCGQMSQLRADQELTINYDAEPEGGVYRGHRGDHHIHNRRFDPRYSQVPISN